MDFQDLAGHALPIVLALVAIILIIQSLLEKDRTDDGKAPTDEKPDEKPPEKAAEDTITVQLTPGSLESRGLAVGKVSLDEIEVGELHSGTGDYGFHWVVTAVRRAHRDFQVVRQWTEGQPAGPDKIGDRWQARLEFIETRDQRMRELDGLAESAVGSDTEPSGTRGAGRQ